MDPTIRVNRALRVLAEPRRRAILELLAGRELSAGQIASNFEVTRPAISQHLGVLESAGLLSQRRAGTRRLYRTRPEAVQRLREDLDAFWDGALARLRSEAEGGEPESSVELRRPVGEHVGRDAGRAIATPHNQAADNQ